MLIERLWQVKEIFVQFKATFESLSLQATSPAVESGGGGGDEPDSRVEDDGDVPGEVGETDTSEEGFSVGKDSSLSRPVATSTRGEQRKAAVKATPVRSHPVLQEGGGVPTERPLQGGAPGHNAV